MSKKTKRLSNQIRDAVRNSGECQSVICRGTGILKSTLSRFMLCERGLGLKSLDVLAEYLGLEIVVKAKPAKKGK